MNLPRSRIYQFWKSLDICAEKFLQSANCNINNVVLDTNVETNRVLLGDAANAAYCGFSMIGKSGCGKSTSLNDLLAHYPQVIIHWDEDGRPFVQILYIVVNCTKKSNFRALYENIGEAIDKALGNVKPVYKLELTCRSKDNLGVVNNKLRNIIERLCIGMIILDEFQNIPPIPDFGNIMATSRSRGILSTIVVQSMKRLEAVYGLEAETIKGNCTNILYLYSRELPLLQEIEALCGTYTNENGREKPLISVSQLQRLPFGDGLILHDRMYPYVTHLPDISEYEFTEYDEVLFKDHTDIQDPDLVDLKKLNALIIQDKFPILFESETPAIDLYLQN